MQLQRTVRHEPAAAAPRSCLTPLPSSSSAAAAHLPALLLLLLLLALLLPLGPA